MSTTISWVLLIDDDEIQNFIHKQIIRNYVLESQIYVAKNGNEGIQLLKSFIQTKLNVEQGILFLDINMPIMNGFQFLKIFNEEFADKFQHVTVYPLSSSDDIKDLIQMNQLGVKEYIVKPLTHEYAINLFD